MQIQFFKASRITFDGLRIKYALEGSFNYVAWKDFMEAILEDGELKESDDNNILN